MNKIEKKLLNKVFNRYIFDYCYTRQETNEFKSDVEHKIVSDMCDFMKKYKI
jgi:hypothetical protein|tara:strand:+ start:285 stop:440 length:156 start_codon:yes stop_codon:yes gene_type:complete